eukprot:4786491-Pleurochrysis_carterae.AAC.1
MSGRSQSFGLWAGRKGEEGSNGDGEYAGVSVLRKSLKRTRAYTHMEPHRHGRVSARVQLLSHAVTGAHPPPLASKSAHIHTQ